MQKILGELKIEIVERDTRVEDAQSSRYRNSPELFNGRATGDDVTVTVKTHSSCVEFG